MTADKKVPTLLRLPSQVREWLDKEAAENGRTLNGEAAFRLRKMMEQEGNGSLQQARA